MNIVVSIMVILILGALHLLRVFKIGELVSDIKGFKSRYTPFMKKIDKMAKTGQLGSNKEQILKDKAEVEMWLDKIEVGYFSSIKKARENYNHARRIFARRLSTALSD